MLLKSNEGGCPECRGFGQVHHVVDGKGKEVMLEIVHRGIPRQLVYREGAAVTAHQTVRLGLVLVLVVLVMLLLLLLLLGCDDSTGIPVADIVLFPTSSADGFFFVAFLASFLTDTHGLEFSTKVRWSARAQ